MSGIARRWDERPAELEDPSTGVPAASLARVPIRNGERQCNRRKAGDLTFDPTTVNDDPEADLFASRRRSGSGDLAKTARTGSAAILGAQTLGGSRTQRDHAVALPPAAAANGTEAAQPEILLGNLDPRATLAQVKPATRRRNPLAGLTEETPQPPPAEPPPAEPPPAETTETTEAPAPAAPGVNGGSAGRRDKPAPEGQAAPSPASAPRTGWRSTFSRWRRKIALGSDEPPADGNRATADAAGTSRVPAPSRNADLYDYWTQLRRGRTLPAWSMIRMDEVARAWPTSFVVSFEPGTGGNGATAPLVKARRVTQDQSPGSQTDVLRLTDTVIEWILATARAAVKHGEPVQDRESFGMHDGQVVYAIVAVPFTGDRSGIEHILCHIKSLPRPGANRRAG